MARKRDEFVEHLLDLFEPFGGVTARAMFGGYGIYKDGVMFGLVADEELFLKTDDENRPIFEDRGLPPFAYTKDSGKQVVMSYHRAPEEALEDPSILRDWSEHAYAAALRKAKRRRKRR